MRYFFTAVAVLLLTAESYGQKKPEKSYFDKAMQKIKSENFEGALLDLNKAIEEDSLNAAAYFKRAFVKGLLLDHEGALPDFDAAIRLNPHDPQYYSERGIARLNLSDKAGACDDWNKAADMGFQPAKDLAYDYCR